MFAIKSNFPIFTHRPELVYLDSAATALKPTSVIEALNQYMEKDSANISRGLYPLAENLTEQFESVRKKTARFIGASQDEIIFTSGTTDSLNMAALLLEKTLSSGDDILTTEMEHHSNFLPWKELAKRKRTTLNVAKLTPEGEIDTEHLRSLISPRTKIIAFSAVSNVLGTINPVQEIIQEVRSTNPDVIVVIDAAQALGHLPLDVLAWDADFVAFSAHKMFGPTGVGVLFGKRSLLESLPPVSFGGGMVLDVYPPLTGRACALTSEYKEVPYRFEAGTPNIAGIIAFGAAIDFVESIGVGNIRKHETELTAYLMSELDRHFNGAITVIGSTDPEKRVGIVSFAFGRLHPHDIASLLGEREICIRAGEHCAAPLHRALELDATTRVSISIYNEKNDIDKLIDGLKIAKRTLDMRN